MAVSRADHAGLKEALNEDIQSIRDILAELTEVDDTVYEALAALKEHVLVAIETDEEFWDGVE